jgi:hypothetical protein
VLQGHVEQFVGRLFCLEGGCNLVLVSCSCCRVALVAAAGPAGGQDSTACRAGSFGCPTSVLWQLVLLQQLDFVPA